MKDQKPINVIKELQTQLENSDKRNKTILLNKVFDYLVKQDHTYRLDLELTDRLLDNLLYYTVTNMDKHIQTDITAITAIVDRTALLKQEIDKVAQRTNKELIEYYERKINKLKEQ